jgi:sialic acid synthase SpsE
MDEDANLGAIFSLKNKYNCPIGYSDHTKDIHVPLYAVAAGAQIIEKHYKISDSMRCIDSPVSITEVQMKEMVRKISELEGIMGTGTVKLNDKTASNLIFKRKN